MQRGQYFPVSFGVRLAEDTAAWVRQRARAERVTPSSYARRCIEEAAKRELILDQNTSQEVAPAAVVP